MKLLLLINSNNFEFDTIEKCKTRSEFITFMLYIYLSEIENIDVSIRKCYPYVSVKHGNNNDIHVFPISDHIIYIDDTGFYHKNESFLTNLKNHTKYSISSLCKGGKFYGGEDMMFTFLNNNVCGKAIYLPIPFDQYIYAPRKLKQTIYVLINKPEVETKQLNKDEILAFLDEIKNLIITTGFNSDNLVFKIGLINTSSVDFIDLDMNIIETQTFEMYIDYVLEISKANMYMVTDTISDIFTLYECVMSGTIIIVNSKYVCSGLDELNMYIYKDDFVWDDIFKMMTLNNARVKFMDKQYDWEKYVKIIISILKDYEKKNEPKTFNRTIAGPKGYLNIHNKHRPHISVKPKPKAIVKPQEPPKRKHVYLQ